MKKKKMMISKELHKVIADMTIRGTKLVNLNLIIIGDYNYGQKKTIKNAKSNQCVHKR